MNNADTRKLKDELTPDQLDSVSGGSKNDYRECVRERRADQQEAASQFANGDFLGGLATLAGMPTCTRPS